MWLAVQPVDPSLCLTNGKDTEVIFLVVVSLGTAVSIRPEERSQESVGAAYSCSIRTPSVVAVVGSVI